MLSLKLSFMSAKDRANLYIFTAALFTVCQMMQCIIVLKVQRFCLRRSKDTLVLLSYKRIVITFHETQSLNIGNQYQKDATLLASGIIEVRRTT